jgi:putative ATP-dependent DNA ligase
VSTVPLLGVYDVEEAAEAVASHVDDLEARGREGVVMKAPDGGTELKYTTSAANRGDLAFAFSLPFDYGQEFMFRRLVREAFRAVEQDDDDEELAARATAVGESILQPMVDTIRTVEDGDLVGERHTVRGRAAVVDSLLAHLRDQRLELVVEEDRTEADERVVTFLKVTRSTTDRTRTYLDGHIVTE